MPSSRQNDDASWLAWLCLSRASFALIFTAYSAAIPLLTPDWCRLYRRGVLGALGAGAFSPWVFGLVLDATRAAHASPAWSWGLAWSAIGVGALLGPLAALRLRRMPESVQMAGGKRYESDSADKRVVHDVHGSMPCMLPNS